MKIKKILERSITEWKDRVVENVQHRYQYQKRT